MMAVINLPSGTSIDFEGASDAQIEETLMLMQKEQPDLFVEPKVSEEEYISSLTTDQAIAYGKSKSEGADSTDGEPDFSPTNLGQITNKMDRYEFGKADIPSEKEAFLTRTYGPDSFGKDNKGNYYLELDNISPEIKAQKGITEESGTMWFNKPGGGFLGLFDMPDVVEFLGEYRGELIGGTAAALATTGIGLIPASLLIGAGAGIGKGVDELQETVEGTQLQSKNEIYGDIATAAAFNAGGNLVVGGALKLIGRVVKGPGNPDAQVISDLMDQGMSRGKATAAAVQMQRAATRKGIKEGARPTISDATGKAILGRVQAIHEGIFPNKTAARANRKYVEDLIKQYKSGELSDEAFGLALDQNAKEVTALISGVMKNPTDAVNLANQQLRNVIEEEMNLLKSVYTTGDETAVAFQNEMTRMVRLWQNNNKELYDNADELLGNSRLFRSSELKNVVKEQIEAPLAKEQNLANNAVYKYISNKTDDYTLSELQTLRTAISNSRSGSLVGDVTDNQLKQLGNKIDEMFEASNMNIQERMFQLEKGIITYKEAGVAAPAGKSDTMFMPKEEAKAMLSRFADGFNKFKAAQAHYSEGADIFKSGAATMLNRNIKDGFFADLSSIVEVTVQSGKPELLKNYLKSVTPEGSIRGTLQTIPETKWLQMAQAAKEGNITEVNRLLQRNITGFSAKEGVKVSSKVLEKVGLSFRPPKIIETLPKNDPYRQRILNDLSETFTLHAEDAAAAATGVSHKNVARQMLASTWIKTAAEGAKDLGVFNPATFRRSFDSLGKEVQEQLFGKIEAKNLNKTLSDFALMAPDEVRKGLRFESAGLNTIVNPKMKNIVSDLQSDVIEAQAQSTNALFQAVKTGRIVDADSMVQAAVKDPALLDDLLNKVPGDVLNQPFGLRDATMSRIMREAFPDGVSESAVISGKWQAGMSAAIANLNQSGALNKILTRDTVQDLIKLTKLPVGDQALKGKGGLASSAYAAVIGMRILAEPVSGLASVAGVYASGRILRSKMFLNMMTRPNIRASEYKRGLRGLTDDILAKAKADGVTITRKQANDSAKQQLGDLSIFRRRLTELASAEMRIMASSKASSGLDADNRRAMGDMVNQAIGQAQPVIQQAGQAVQQATQPAPPVQGPPPMAPNQQSMQALRNTIDPRVQAQRALVGGGP